MGCGVYGICREAVRGCGKSLWSLATRTPSLDTGPQLCWDQSWACSALEGLKGSDDGSELQGIMVWSKT